MKIACVQSNVVFNDPGANTAKAIDHLRLLKKQGVDLAVFPEAYLTGYCVEAMDDARKIAIDARSKYIEEIRLTCEGLDMMAVVGFAELGSELEAWGSGQGNDHNDTTALRNTTPSIPESRTPDLSSSPKPRASNPVFNSAALFEPGQETRFYRKSHLPELGLDKFVCRGHGPLDVFDTRLGKIGILICFDFRMPEACRVLALKGAQILVLPTNWPEGAEITADYTPITRATENRIFVATCDRVGEENGFKFIGRSKIIEPSGKVLASAGDKEETIVAELDLAFANQKRVVTVPGRYEIEVFKARRPELYLDLTRDLEG